jgi:hypothetical protein
MKSTIIHGKEAKQITLHGAIRRAKHWWQTRDGESKITGFIPCCIVIRKGKGNLLCKVSEWDGRKSERQNEMITFYITTQLNQQKWKSNAGWKVCFLLATACVTMIMYTTKYRDTPVVHNVCLGRINLLSWHKMNEIR